MINLNLTYGNGIMHVDVPYKILGIQIDYIGLINCKNLLSKDYDFFKTKNKIIIVSKENQTISSNILEYEGEIVIKKCVAITDNFEKKNISFGNKYLDYWIKQQTTYEKSNMEWQTLKQNNLVGKPVVNPKDILGPITKEHIKIAKNYKKKVKGIV